MIFTRVKLWLLGAFGFLAIIAAAFIKGRQIQANREATRVLRDYTDTRKRIDEANRVDRDADDARKWLRNRGK
jgi:cell fate (sporulation/competence/biofilm development) regulator YlbF (YheA/YmcA/DUF963 family)